MFTVNHKDVSSCIFLSVRSNCLRNLVWCRLFWLNGFPQKLIKLSWLTVIFHCIRGRERKMNSECQILSGLSECMSYEVSAWIQTDSGFTLEMPYCFETVKWTFKLSKANRFSVVSIREHKCKSDTVNYFVLLLQRFYTMSPWGRYLQHVLPHARHVVWTYLSLRSENQKT